jgi:hypothetical protein
MTHTGRRHASHPQRDAGLAWGNVRAPISWL